MTHAMPSRNGGLPEGGGRAGGGQERGSRPGTATGVWGPRSFVVFSARGRAASRTCEVKGREGAGREGRRAQGEGGGGGGCARERGRAREGEGVR